jgi:hypothetical protein
LRNCRVNLELHVLLDFSVLATSVQHYDYDVQDNEEEDDHDEDISCDPAT